MANTKANNKRRKPSQGGDCAKEHTVEQQVLEAKITEISEEDDLLQAFRSEELHLDFAHLITLGYFMAKVCRWRQQLHVGNTHHIADGAGGS
eukprot:2217946-Rhodomonas_salina.1